MLQHLTSKVPCFARLTNNNLSVESCVVQGSSRRNRTGKDVQDVQVQQNNEHAGERSFTDTSSVVLIPFGGSAELAYLIEHADQLLPCVLDSPRIVNDTALLSKFVRNTWYSSEHRCLNSITLYSAKDKTWVIRIQNGYDTMDFTAGLQYICETASRQLRALCENIDPTDCTDALPHGIHSHVRKIAVQSDTQAYARKITNYVGDLHALMGADVQNYRIHRLGKPIYQGYEDVARIASTDPYKIVKRRNIQII